MRPHRLLIATAVAACAAAATSCGGDDTSSGATSATAVAPAPVTVPEPASTVAPPPTTATSSTAAATAGSSVSVDPDATTTSIGDLAAWQTLEIVDVTGASFTLADLAGAPVLVETFATWCSNCRAQLADTQQAAATLGGDATVLALSVETDLSPDDVADYAADNGFADVRFAVMSPEMLAAFADEFGTTVANPPSTPKIVITAGGQAGDLQTGPASADDLVAQLRAAS